MKKSNPLTRDVPLQWFVLAVPAVKDSLPPEIVDNAADYKLRMDDVRTAFFVGHDEEGYFVRATEVYRLVK